ncbi:hypothetical protein PISMIDRAFT_18138 [Pisolithus microcarpus 441]|uniref:Uncharacterized protein n=1 Tax=Pisolithus microcarpus 441 TaxID=765257 RepID=A0A0C9XLI6_9AGAM|nr:hypothetical protein BKA83DRAFT_18138 [Pisolithus microcarpus]KIK13205.1 hypothetical protein PISMIDRAFT_18138 [Pisolithus microcarpus 441]
MLEEQPVSRPVPRTPSFPLDVALAPTCAGSYAGASSVSPSRPSRLPLNTFETPTPLMTTSSDFEPLRTPSRPLRATSEAPSAFEDLRVTFELCPHPAE